LFVIGSGRLERELVKNGGFAVRSIESPSIRRKLSAEMFRSISKNLVAKKAADAIIKEFQPDAAVCFGGAVTFHVARAARSAGIPVIVQEQNAVPGLANRQIARFAAVVAVPGKEAMFGWPAGARLEITGTPVRMSGAGPAPNEAKRSLGLAEGLKTVTVFGGSQGAKRINDAVVGAYGKFSANRDIQLLHITGTRDFDATMIRWSEARAPENVRLLPYLDEMVNAYKASDLMVCRAGAGTLAELAVFGVPAILIPYSYASADHQTKNASVPLSAGAAIVLSDDELSSDSLAAMVTKLIADEKGLNDMAAAMRDMGKPEAAKTLADIVEGVAKKTSV
jgi:UDP-N-acetylglucosamine--N-acetylmuramyl-(pentapeptide) pyrophosphoryl-undecaprenol N-acetylglucosamine transferase